MRLTQKNEFFEYALPCQNVVGDNQATEISLGETEYTCKKYIIGEAINKLGELEDVLEKYGIESAEDLDNIINSIIDKLYSILNNINDNNDNYLKEAKQKFMRTVKMYIINNRDIPEFEKTAANNIGLDINTINSIINVIKNKV